jgi:hypothetical protein
LFTRHSSTCRGNGGHSAAARPPAEGPKIAQLLITWTARRTELTRSDLKSCSSPATAARRRRQACGKIEAAAPEKGNNMAEQTQPIPYKLSQVFCNVVRYADWSPSASEITILIDGQSQSMSEVCASMEFLHVGLCPACGRRQVGKNFFTLAELVGAPVCSAFSQPSHHAGCPARPAASGERCCQAPAVRATNDATRRRLRCQLGKAVASQRTPGRNDASTAGG